MESTSLGISALSLAIQLSYVVADNYSRLRQTRDPETPLSDEVALQVQQCRFASWTKATGLADGRAIQFQDSFMQRTLINALSDMIELLYDAFGPDSKYGLVFQPTISTEPELWSLSRRASSFYSPSTATSDARGPGVIPKDNDYIRAQELLESARLSFLAFQQSQWTVSNPLLFKSLVRQLREKNDNLEWLVPLPVRISAKEIFEATILQSKSVGRLKCLAEATSGSLPCLAQSADSKSAFIETNVNGDVLNQANHIKRDQLVLDHTDSKGKGHRTLATYEVPGAGSQRVLVEWKRTGVLKSSSSIEESKRSTKDRFKRLAVILAKPTDATFRALVCLGYSTSLDDRISLVFKLPTEAAKAQYPVSLKDLFIFNQIKRSSKPNKTSKPPLEERLRLSHKLALAIYRLHRTGLIHKVITPTNIVFFPDKSTSSESILEPYLTGFDFAREEITVNHSEIPEEQNDDEQLYRNPSWKVSDASTKAVDIYSFGVVLIQISCWEPIAIAKAKSIKDKAADFRSFLLTEFVDSGFLAYRMGTDFQNAVKHCLDVGLESEELGENNVLGSFYGNVVQGLSPGSSTD